MANTQQNHVKTEKALAEFGKKLKKLEKEFKSLGKTWSAGKASLLLTLTNYQAWRRWISRQR